VSGRRRTKRLGGAGPFGQGIFAKSKSGSKDRPLKLSAASKVAGVLAVTAAICVGLVYLKKYVERTTGSSGEPVVLELVNPPYWVNDALKGRIYLAATAGGQELRIDEDVAQRVQRNIESFTGWLDEVTVQTTGNSVRIYSRWRKPIAVVQWGLYKFYLDSDAIALEYAELTELPIVKVTGFIQTQQTPAAGGVLQNEDLAAAAAILARLNRRDELEAGDKRLLYEIDRIDVSNFGGRKDNRSPHIVMYTTDDTQIIWGAELGKWQRYMEATDEQKIASLYSYYKEKGTLLGGVKYIRLCDPQQRLSLPVDNY